MAYKRSNFPETYDVFVEKLDLPASKLPLIEEYHTLYTKEVKTDEEKARLNVLMKDLENHLYTPEHMNHFQDAMTNVQKFFKDETQGHVNELQNETIRQMNITTTAAKEVINDTKASAITHIDGVKLDTETSINSTAQFFEAKVEQFDDVGVFDISKQYYKNNFIHYNGRVYLSLKENLGVSPVDDGIRWRLLTIKGDTGYGVGVTPQGEFKVSTTYHEDDIVFYNGNLYRCIQTSVNKLPTTPTYFELFLAGSGENYADLNTDNKESIVSAVNEVNNKISKSVSEPTSGLLWLDTNI